MSLWPNKLKFSCEFFSNVSYNKLFGFIPTSNNFTRSKLSCDLLHFAGISCCFYLSQFIERRSKRAAVLSL
ncbi:hypothetical protein VIGAN_01122500 [Vigna angularis var. angularis]|uniref:Uncharacterized protein n=1 Tax=Vigna angularis var. angularis TaxID=157739 RepID=A0A0S3QZC7_PHAAN|nr:hypothetical protein VIGAN_01122500 [Vigna angularis var. angularis]